MSIGDKDGKAASIDPAAMFKLSYGLFVLTARDGGKDNGCIINTAIQITQKPLRLSIAVNKGNFTHDMILKTGEFNVSILTEHTPFSIFERFGFHSGRDTDKFDGFESDERTVNGIRYIADYVNCVISAKVISTEDFDTHTVFFADITQAFVQSNTPSATYQYYFDNIKPKPGKPLNNKVGFICKICGYIHEGDTLPEDFICPLCKHSAIDFEPLR